MNPLNQTSPIPWSDVSNAFIRVPDAVKQLKTALGSYSRSAFYRDAAHVGAKPLGIRQRPAVYPASVVKLILARRGVAVTLPPEDTAAARLSLPTLAELRRIKPAKATKAKAKR
jgi:hypothetical protein